MSIIHGFRKYLKDPITLEEANLGLKKYYSFVFGIRKFLKDQVTLEEAREIVRYRMENREENFLKIVEKGIYGYKRSPYLGLLKHADYRFSDVKRLVNNDGIESALKTLREEGVYVSYEESKGKTRIIRNGKTIETQESDFHNPHIASYYEGRTGATRSAGTKIRSNFNFLEQRAPYEVLLNDIYGIQDAPKGIWLHVLPVLSGTNRILRNAKIGAETSKWFTPMDPNENVVHRVNKWILNAMLYEGRLLGKKLPKPEFVNPKDAVVIAKWIDSKLKEFGACIFYTSPGLAVRICNEAEKSGLELDGGTFILGGEPLSKAKLKRIRSIKCSVINHYVMSESGTIGYGCKNPVNGDEVHFFKDSLALIQHKRKIVLSETEIDSMLLTSLLTSAPRILFNMETDDFGIVESRDCGCGFQDLGFTEHIHNIRSFTKLTGEGVTFLGIDVIKVLEEELPRLFGGGPIDYQIVEKEDSYGLTKIILNVSPDVSGINEEELKEKLIELLNPSGRDTNIDMWEKAESFLINRSPPILTRSGKIMPIHIIDD
ncbi:MAG: hypothetical protein ACXADW_08665 [Candidatus Hodarchaeales archaeon]|jgi:hypothetical protein